MYLPCRTIRQGGSFFVGGHRIENRRYTAKYSGTSREYTGVYRAIDGVCDAGPFRPIGVIMPISLSIPMQYIRTVTRNILSFLFVFLFLFLFCIPVYTEMTCIFVADKDAETA